MADLTLRAGDIHAVGVVAKDALDGDCFRGVSKRRAGAVSVDVADLLGVHFRVDKGTFLGLVRAGVVFVWLRDLSGVGAGAVAAYFAVDTRTAAFGVL